MNYVIEGDVLYQPVLVPDPDHCYHNNIYHLKEVMTKEAFIKCYQEWILKEEAKEGIELG